MGLFKGDKAVPAMAFPRIQRWALLLAAYDYELAYREGSKHGNADGLNRLPLSDTVVEVPVPGETILLMDRLEALPVCADDIADQGQPQIQCYSRSSRRFRKVGVTNVLTQACSLST